MTDAPKKIWVHYEVETDEAMWSEYPDTDGIEDFLHYGEYTRSDIAQARIDEQVAWVRDLAKDLVIAEARIDTLEAARDKAILELWPWVSVGFDMPADTQREKYTLEVIKNALEALKKGQDLEALKLKEDE